MIATRLHAKRHSISALKRPSIISAHSTPHLHVQLDRRGTSKQPFEEIHNIDTDDDAANEIQEGSKVESISHHYFRL